MTNTYETKVSVFNFISSKYGISLYKGVLSNPNQKLPLYIVYPINLLEYGSAIVNTYPRN